MKRLALVAAIVAVSACQKTETTPADTMPAMAPAPATPMDTGMKMDTTKMDTAKGKTGAKKTP
jgi:hypothetical protein